MCKDLQKGASIEAFSFNYLRELRSLTNDSIPFTRSNLLFRYLHPRHKILLDNYDFVFKLKRTTLRAANRIVKKRAKKPRLDGAADRPRLCQEPAAEPATRAVIAH